MLHYIYHRRRLIKDADDRLSMVGSSRLRILTDPYQVSTQTQGNITTEVYQIECRHRCFPDTLNVVCLLKINAKLLNIWGLLVLFVTPLLRADPDKLAKVLLNNKRLLILSNFRLKSSRPLLTTSLLFGILIFGQPSLI